jgi:hypothetical protein
MLHACVGMRRTEKHRLMPTQAWSMAPVKYNLQDYSSYFVNSTIDEAAISRNTFDSAWASEA